MIRLGRYQSGEIIVRENDPGGTAYVIEEGQVEVSKQRDGRAVHLAYLEAGETFGEMSMIDEKPRSATITAVKPTLVREIQRDDFFNSLQTDPKAALTLLRVLFERLRQADAMILQLQKTEFSDALTPAKSLAVIPSQERLSATLEGITPQAVASLPATPLAIARFPFRIGRQSGDPLDYNDLAIADSAPMQISRHHLSFIAQEGRIGVVDRGSTLGSWVDGQQIGGPSSFPGPVFFTKADSLLVLGRRDSPFRYRVSLPTKS